eukprot:scaffold57418_cov17-Prasinocladus_malaysianus.AAC.1
MTSDSCPRVNFSFLEIPWVDRAAIFYSSSSQLAGRTSQGGPELAGQVTGDPLLPHAYRYRYKYRYVYCCGR